MTVRRVGRGDFIRMGFDATKLASAGLNVAASASEWTTYHSLALAATRKVGRRKVGGRKIRRRKVGWREVGWREVGRAYCFRL
jgi:hypothetical protein